MNRVIFTFFTIIIFLYSPSIPSSFPTTETSVFAEKAIPPYAKWGRLAMEKTKERYPNSDIIDYLHIGREVKGDVTVERFKLWLRNNKKEFGVFITISFKTKTGDLLDITFRETTQ
ncbi:hypothetical protein CIB95_12730 [Lottiidibacillus patelloidae]|uniref:DUF3889 domain-containing protein n=1 Tax=Lottiidibacillus patelloidae TaxID=2670334 RepID=A0A263BRE8_9BACI|nr:DUF3889 domain-containing protein [Lottiidibacillus patelloidae]OZM56281.1 hypothetical protein CIB95_12730 [Lottiidibacillus patelloidae]